MPLPNPLYSLDVRAVTAWNKHLDEALNLIREGFLDAVAPDAKPKNCYKQCPVCEAEPHFIARSSLWDNRQKVATNGFSEEVSFPCGEGWRWDGRELHHAGWCNKARTMAISRLAALAPIRQRVEYVTHTFGTDEENTVD